MNTGLSRKMVGVAGSIGFVGPTVMRFELGMWLVNRRHRQRGRRHLTAAVLVCLMMMANASQGMVLCFGAHGHVAIEPAGHHHCGGTLRYHSHDHSSDTVQEDAVPLFTPPQYDPCVDIPLPLGPPHERLSLIVLKTAAVVVIAEPPVVFENLSWHAVALGDVLPFASDTLLGTIVLQV